MYTFTITEKTASIFPSSEANAPIIYLNTFSGEGQKVYEAAQVAGRPPFTLVAISNLDWHPGTVRPLSKMRTPVLVARTTICGF